MEGQEERKSNIRMIWFLKQVTKNWNSLSEWIVSATSIKLLESRLDKFWENKEIKYICKAQITTAHDRKVVEAPDLEVDCE